MVTNKPENENGDELPKITLDWTIGEIDRLRRMLHGLLNGDPEVEKEVREMLYQ